MPYCKFRNFREGFFREIFAGAKFRENKLSRNDDVDNSCPSRDFKTSQICLNLNKIPAKIPEFTVITDLSTDV